MSLKKEKNIMSMSNGFLQYNGTYCTHYVCMHLLNKITSPLSKATYYFQSVMKFIVRI